MREVGPACLTNVHSSLSMASSLLSKIAPNMMAGARAMSTGTVERKVCVVGAAGGIGQSLSMLMKMNPAVTRLSLYDVMGTPGVAADVSHMNTKVRVLRRPPLRRTRVPEFRRHPFREMRTRPRRVVSRPPVKRTVSNCSDGRPVPS